MPMLPLGSPIPILTWATAEVTEPINRNRTISKARMVQILQRADFPCWPGIFCALTHTAALAFRGVAGVVERPAGIGPASLAWEAKELPLYDGRRTPILQQKTHARPRLFWTTSLSQHS